MRLLVILLLILPVVSTAANYPTSCRIVEWNSDTIIRVNSAVNHGTRIQFPSDLKREPTSSNPEMWKTNGEMNQVLLKPTSKTKYGASAVVRVFTKAGYAYDVHVNRTNHAEQDICVKVVHAVDRFATVNDELSAMAFVGPQTQQALMYQNMQHQNQLSEQQRVSDDRVRKAVVESLRRYRYHIYTRYNWPEKETVISDVYDDGRFTYIRLNRSNAGLMSVESKLGGKTEVVEADYDDSYGMYQIVGIYPEFTMILNNNRIEINRRDFLSRGEF